MNSNQIKNTFANQYIKAQRKKRYYINSFHTSRQKESKHEERFACNALTKKDSSPQIPRGGKFPLSEGRGINRAARSGISNDFFPRRSSIMVDRVQLKRRSRLFRYTGCKRTGFQEGDEGWLARCGIPCKKVLTISRPCQKFDGQNGGKGQIRHGVPCSLNSLGPWMPRTTVWELWEFS